MGIAKKAYQRFGHFNYIQACKDGLLSISKMKQNCDNGSSLKEKVPLVHTKTIDWKTEKELSFGQ